MTAGPGELSVVVQAGSDADTEELAQLADRLRPEFLDLDVDAVWQPVRGEASEDAKGADLLAAGELVVGLIASPEVLASIIDTVRSRLGRNRARSVKLTLDWDALEVTGMSSAEQERLIDPWVTCRATSA
jgi:hypothetical protein